MRKTLFLTLFLLGSLFFNFSAFAKSINLYDEPKDQAKIVGTLDSNKGIIPIFTPEKGDWIKVADPRNGNVGWVKMKDLGSADTSEYTFTQRFINTGNSPQTYQIIQFGGPNKMSADQVQLELKKAEQQQQKLQENMNKAMQNMLNDMNSLYHWNSQWLNNGTPFVMPVIVIPAQTLPANKIKTPEKTTAPKKQKPTEMDNN